MVYSISVLYQFTSLGSIANCYHRNDCRFMIVSASFYFSFFSFLSFIIPTVFILRLFFLFLSFCSFFFLILFPHLIKGKFQQKSQFWTLILFYPFYLLNFKLTAYIMLVQFPSIKSIFWHSFCPFFLFWKKVCWILGRKSSSHVINQ